ncbi:HNH endonuclease [Rhodococcus aerolatus]
MRAAPPPGGSVSDDRERVDLIAELEAVKSAACAAQASLAVALDRSTRAREAADAVPAERRGRGVAAQVALARRESPHRGSALLGLARDLHTDLPHTRAALAEGRLSEYAATLVARESGCLDREGRAVVDAELCADPATLEGVGTNRLTGMLRARVAALDPAAVTRRARRAVSERHVSLRPAPDAMTYLTALLPVAQGVACLAALGRAADTTRATGAQGLSRGQVMADTLVQRVTGQATAEGVPVSVSLVVSDASLLGAGSEPAVVPGHGPVPAQIAREMVADSLDATSGGARATTPTWLRRVYADPAGQLVALSSRQRFVADGLAALLRVRDQGLCRTPYCDAPARHDDHVVPDAAGGPTTADNTQGLCEACNYRKDAPGWAARPVAGQRHTVETTTPTGHRYRSRAPAPPRPARVGRLHLVPPPCEILVQLDHDLAG